MKVVYLVGKTSSFRVSSCLWRTEYSCDLFKDVPLKTYQVPISPGIIVPCRPYGLRDCFLWHSSIKNIQIKPIFNTEPPQDLFFYLYQNPQLLHRNSLKSLYPLASEALITYFGGSSHFRKAFSFLKGQRK